MNFTFFNRLSLKKVVSPTANEAGRQAEKIVQALLQELPDLLLTYVADTKSATVLAFYTSSSAYNPNQLSLRNARLLQTMHEALASGAWVGGALTDVAVILEESIHYLQPLGGDRYCFLAVRLADANVGLVKKIVQRCVI